MTVAERAERAFSVLPRWLSKHAEAVAARQLNEADTRFRLIDRMLTEVLLWNREAIETEPDSEKGYLDYLLTVGEQHRGILVIEAKKSGSLRPATASDKKCSLLLEGQALKPLREGIEQALGYASARGVPFAALTDGTTWLFFKASRTDGIAPLKGKGILFPSVKSIKEDFVEFFELLSADALQSRLNLVHLNKAEGLLTQLSEKHYVALAWEEARLLARSPLANDQALLFRQFFSRLNDENNREMFRICFVATDESDRADVELQKVVEKLLNTAMPIETAQGAALVAEIEQTFESKESEAILLVGNKGSGKSTFVDRFFNDVLPPSVRSKCVVARVDLSEHTGDVKLLIPWVIGKLRDQLELGVCSNNPPTYEDLQGIFWGEYRRWQIGPYKSLYESDKTAFKVRFGEHMDRQRESRPDEYVKLLVWRSFVGLQKLPCLVFDNTDQFPAATQDAVYQLAHALGSVSPTLTIVPITDRSIWRLAKAGALQSYPAKAFFLPVPEVKEILSRRVAFVKSKLDEEPSAAKAYFSRKGFNVTLSDLSLLARAVELVFVETDFVSGLIGRLANFDIRRMLELAQRIFLSPELQIDELIKSIYGGFPITADVPRTHRAMLKGEYDRYSPQENPFISNLFWTNADRPATPVLAIYVLLILQVRAGHLSASVDDRHVRVQELVDFLEPCGIDPVNVLETTRRLFEARLVEALDPSLQEISIEDRIALRSSGEAHLDLAFNSPEYMRAMALATGINVSGIRDKIRSLNDHADTRSLRELEWTFATYLRDLDVARCRLPLSSDYRLLREGRSRLDAIVSDLSKYFA